MWFKIFAIPLLYRQQLAMQSNLNSQDFYNLLTGRTPQSFSRALNRKFKQNNVELTKEQWSVLALLWKHDGKSQQYLADESYRTRPSITRLIDNMEKEGLVERRNDRNDRRSNLVFLTQKGRLLEEKVIQLVQQTVSVALNGVSDEEIRAIRVIFEKIYNNLEEK